MGEFKIDTDLKERNVECRDKDVSHVTIPDLELMKKNFESAIEMVDLTLKNLDSICEVEVADNILRAQIVFLESAFDYFCHCFVKFGFHKILIGEWSSTEKYQNFCIPMSVITNAKNNDDNKYYEDYLNEKISSMTFLDPKILSDNLNLVYCQMLCEIAKDIYPSEKNPIDALKSELSRIYTRRNMIAHQDDREHSNLEKRPINVEEVKDFKNKIVSITDAMIKLGKLH